MPNGERAESRIRGPTGRHLSPAGHCLPEAVYFSSAGTIFINKQRINTEYHNDHSLNPSGHR